MAMRRLLLIVALVLSLPVLVQSQSTRITSGPTLPTNCADGNVFLKTGASPGLYWCSTPGSPGTWTGPLSASVGTVTTTGAPSAGNLTVFSGASSITSGNLSGDGTTSGSAVFTLANTAVTPGSYTLTSLTVDSKGRLTAASSGADACWIPLVDGSEPPVFITDGAGVLTLVACP